LLIERGGSRETRFINAVGIYAFRSSSRSDVHARARPLGSAPGLVRMMLFGLLQ
jgi:hypothetical protein